MENNDRKELLELARKIKILRKNKGVTQEQAYNDTGIHFARIEQGKRNINYLTLQKICRYFNISFLDFFKE